MPAYSVKSTVKRENIESLIQEEHGHHLRDWCGMQIRD